MERTLNSDVYDPENNSSDAKLPDVIEEILDKEGELETPDLAEEIEENGLFSEDTARSKLYYIKQDPELNVEITKKKGGSQGSDTLVWKLSK
jgi:hypothetical protein